MKKYIILTVIVAILSVCLFIGCGHNHEYETQVIDPTCAERGYTIHKCKTCGDEYRDNYTEKLSHDYSASVVDPTCAEQGYTLHKCVNCGDEYRDNYTEKLPHLFSEYVIQEKSTCTTPGCRARVCEFCGEEVREYSPLDPDAHTFVTVENQAGHFHDDECCECGYNYRAPAIKINTLSGEPIEGDATTAEYYDTTISVEDCADSYLLSDVNAQVKVRGNATANADKKPYRIKFEKKQKMLGLNGDLKAKSWVLLADYFEPSKLRNATALYIADKLFGEDGYYSSDFRVVRVYINDEFMGVYLLAEQQQTGAGRVEINEPAKNYQSTDIGYLVEMDGYYMEEVELERFEVNYDGEIKYANGNTADNGKFQKGYAIKSDIYSAEQNAFIKKIVENTYTVLADAVYGDHSNLAVKPYKTLNSDMDIVDDFTIHTAKQAVEKIIELDSLVDTVILNEICTDADVNFSSFYLSVDMSESGSHKVRFEAPWDFDNGLGDEVTATTSFYCGRTNNPWLLVLINADWFKDLVARRFFALMEEFDINAYIETLRGVATEFEEYYTADAQKYGGVTGRHAKGEIITIPQAEGTEELCTYLAGRLRWLERNLLNWILPEEPFV